MAYRVTDKNLNEEIAKLNEELTVRGAEYDLVLRSRQPWGFSGYFNFSPAGLTNKELMAWIGAFRQGLYTADALSNPENK